MTNLSATPRIISDQDFLVNFKPEFARLFQPTGVSKVAILATSEYEGIYKNGGVGTHYKTLSEQLAADGWYVVLLLWSWDDDRKFGGKSSIPVVRHIFTTAEIQEVVELQPVHLGCISSESVKWLEHQSLCYLYYIQALINQFAGLPIYVEFHEMTGIGYHTIQAKQSGLLGSNCVIAVTMHSGNEWIYEANEWFAEEYNEFYLQVCDYERFSFENADLTFFPSYHLKSRVEVYGWKTDHGHHMPYFIPLIESVSTLPCSQQISQIVGMTTLDERLYVQDYAENSYTGQGQIVDLGCWLGSFTVPLAIGLQNNRRVQSDQVYIHAYDLFEWADWMRPFVENTPWQGKYQDGDSFLDAFEAQIEPWKHQIKVYPGDLTLLNWDRETPIEFLLVDAMKSWDLTNSIIQKFFPSLVPSLSLVHHQDFVHYYTPWIHLIMYRFKDYFEPIRYVLSSGSFIFKYRKAIPAEWLDKDYSFKDFSQAEIDAAFDYSLSLVPLMARSSIAAAKAMIYVHLEQFAEAEAQIQWAQNNGFYSEESEFNQVRFMLQLKREQLGLVN